MSTAAYDSPMDYAFRSFVRAMAAMGYGRMAQIVDEEWRKIDRRDGGLLTLCRVCDTLLDHADGEPHEVRQKKVDKTTELLQVPKKAEHGQWGEFNEVQKQTSHWLCCKDGGCLVPAIKRCYVHGSETKPDLWCGVSYCALHLPNLG